MEHWNIGAVINLYLPVRIEKVESLVGDLFRSLHYVDIVHNNLGCHWPTLQNTLHGSFSKFRFLIDKVATKLNLHLLVSGETPLSTYIWFLKSGTNR